MARSAKLANGLTQKEEAFCLAFARLGAAHGNASEAYRQVYDCKRAKPETINRSAHTLLRKPKIGARIEELRSDAAKAVGLTVEKVLRHLNLGLDFDPAKLYKEDGTLKNVTEMDENTRMALAGMEIAEIAGGIGYVKKVKWLDKNTVRDQAMKHFGLYKRDNEQRTPPDQPLSHDDMIRTMAFMLASISKRQDKKQPA